MTQHSDQPPIHHPPQLTHPTSYSFRFEKLKAKDSDFEYRFSNLGNLAIKNGATEFNWESNIDNVQ